MATIGDKVVFGGIEYEAIDDYWADAGCLDCDIFSNPSDDPCPNCKNVVYRKVANEK